MDASACTLCPRCCAVDRARERGVCGEGDTVRLARAALHFWEEPPVSGEAGSGTVFFSGCPLRCVYCQNKDIARGEIGREISIERLARIFLEQQERGALNINLVTPTHFAPQIKAALDLARSYEFSSTPLALPVVYNTSGYETVEAITNLAGYVDVFLTDFKYASPELARRYSAAPDYPEVASKALDAMFELVGPLAYDETERGEERLACGVIVRHLLLPGCLDDSKHVMELLAAKPYIDDIIVSIMNQFTPASNIARDYPELARGVSDGEYDELIDHALELCIVNSFMQEGGAASESFIPAFDYEGV